MFNMWILAKYAVILQAVCMNCIRGGAVVEWMKTTTLQLLKNPLLAPVKITLLHSALHSHSHSALLRSAHILWSSHTDEYDILYLWNSCLAQFHALWMKHIHSFRTGIMAEYPVMSTSQDTYGRIEQTLYVIRGLGLGNAALPYCDAVWQDKNSTITHYERGICCIQWGHNYWL